MIELLIFHCHIVGALYAFTKNWQKRGLREGILAVLVIALVFTIGWALTNPLAWLIMPHKPWSKIWFNQDTLSLVLLFIPEVFFFYFFFVRDRV